MKHPLGTFCTRCGTVLHEFLHALGFIHEQASRGRDRYVTIVWENIAPGEEYNFAMYDEGETTNFGEKYDYDSLMHYSAYAFSVNGSKTIVTKSRNRNIGQRRQLSEIDTRKINKLYCSKDRSIVTNETSATKPSTSNKMNDDKESNGKSNVQPEHFRKLSKKREHRRTSLWQ
ncbi:hypothetical protein ILUMI_10149 [Ignelater luminosus]|uniref:Metalloendopeptidase n=1 Tax=Ignelater luminosus TaxID=2038154 RepID=A0A8K0GEE7_IGNLU|nr:hypothetical protein ILUMI_10149 [Ignelater luminosus]